jgi:site-specific DNA-methyltransferase (adenine-specific)
MVNNPVIRTEHAVVYAGSNLDILPTLPENSVDAIVCDPPYELGFMGKSWDNSGIAYSVELWRECLRVLKPGGHLLAFGGTRTWHRLAVAIEDAGFEIRDNIAWLYGSGFPKSLNIAKSIEAKIITGSANKTAFKKLQGEQIERGDWGIAKQQQTYGQRATNYDETAGATRLGKLDATTPEAQQWDGWGTALKPAHEPIVVARKPLIGTVAENVLQHRTGGLNIDSTRIGTEGGTKGADFGEQGNVYGNGLNGNFGKPVEGLGRFPANIILDEFTAELLDEQSDASRFFYVAKASKRDRNEGLDDIEGKEISTKGNGLATTCDTCGATTLDGCDCPDRTYSNPVRQNFHPTVKPTALMQYLIRLVTPPNGIVLDPFAGSGSTGKAAILENKQFIGIEITTEYLPIIQGRLEHAEQTLLTKADDLFE